ncbi:MAG: hypothetical protein IKW90_04390 [Lachnospiraceae bacterium]|nr:hypothetical protein [Lachnospiraceae bacterium]
MKIKGLVIYKATALLCMSALLLSGCSSDEEETHSIAIVRESMENEYDLTRCETRDVIKTESISCTYSQLMEENLAFPVGEKTVAFVYVNEGDEVKPGDLVAKLDVASLEQDNVNMRAQLERNALLISQADEMIEYYEKKIETPGISLSTKESYLTKLQKLREKRRTYTDENDFNTIKISANEQQIAAGSLYAGIEGNISYIKKNLEGSSSNAGETVITILNASVCGFQAMDRNAVEYIQVGDRVQVVTNQTGDVYDSTVTSVDKDSLKIIFELDQPDFSIKMGTRGTVTVVRGEAKGVLSLPKTCVFEAEDFWFVYVLTDEGVREMRKVTIGLMGNDYVEIKGGISESDSVILRKS